jgi:hydroxyethylthiazole kinase-like uncharacterized protein yjeF
MPKLSELNLSKLTKHLAPRQADAHKGNFGHVLIIGGDYGYPGAPVLAALGALRVGAGLVTLASHRDQILGLNSYHPEIMATDIDTPTLLTNSLLKATVVVLGPGLGRTAWSQEVYNLAINTNLPLVLDADGLFFLAQNPIKRSNWVLTPHPGEASALLHQPHGVAPEARLTAIDTLIQNYSATVVLKGSGTLVGSPNTEVQICKAGNPGMASGGMGDLLSGVIAGLIAQGLNTDIAAKLAVSIHATAGDKAALHGQRGLIATDLLAEIRKLI